MPVPPPDIMQMQRQNNIDGLIEALQYPDPNVRRHAVASLRLLAVWYAVPALTSALAAEADWQTHRAIVETIEYLDHDVHLENIVKSKDVRGLAKMLNSPRADDVVLACRTLGELGSMLAVEPLIILFRNPLVTPKIRLAAAEALLKLKSAPALVSLLGALRSMDWQARRNAASVLGQIRAVWAVDPLISALGDNTPVVRRAAAGALRRIATPEAIAAAQIYENSEPPTPPAPVTTADAVAPPVPPLLVVTIPAPAKATVDPPSESATPPPSSQVS